MEFWRKTVPCHRTGNRKCPRANGYSVRRWNEQISRCGGTEVWSTGDRADRNTVFRQVWRSRRTDARERIVWNEHAPRCRASGAGDGWRQKRDFFEVAGGWVWQQHASHRTDSPVLWQGAHCNNPASKERGPWRERGMHHWWAFDGSYAADVCESTMYLSARWREMPDSKTDSGRLLGCGLSWMEEWRTRWSWSTRTLHLARRRAEPNQMNSVFDALSLSRLFVIQTPILPMQSTSLDVRGACRRRHSGRRSACHRHIHEWWSLARQRYRRHLL